MKTLIFLLPCSVVLEVNIILQLKHQSSFTNFIRPYISQWFGFSLMLTLPLSCRHIHCSTVGLLNYEQCTLWIMRFFYFSVNQSSMLGYIFLLKLEIPKVSSSVPVQHYKCKCTAAELWPSLIANNHEEENTFNLKLRFLLVHYFQLANTCKYCTVPSTKKPQTRKILTVLELIADYSFSVENCH